jgi:uncharacterized membrane protein
MNQTHLHLIITHLPIFGSILGAIVLVFGIWSKSSQTKIAAYFLFIISAIGAAVAYVTGEEAEDTVEKIQGISKDLINQHEDIAAFALISLIILGVGSLISLVLTYKDSKFSGAASIVMLIISLISFSILARTGWLGGKIRHTEISNTSIQNSSNQEKPGKDDD